jgi:hypothetical protein
LLILLRWLLLRLLLLLLLLHALQFLEQLIGRLDLWLVRIALLFRAFCSVPGCCA